MLLETESLKTFGIADISFYPPGFTIVNPSFEITPPGYSKVTLDFDPKSANVYRAFDLGITCDEECGDLPDGIYLVKYSISPNSQRYIQQSFVRVDALRKKYYEAFLRADLSCDCSISSQEKYFKQLMQIERLINYIVASANNCDEVTAWKLYGKANKLLDQFECC